jgi:hypothetical protein
MKDTDIKFTIGGTEINTADLTYRQKQVARNSSKWIGFAIIWMGAGFWVAFGVLLVAIFVNLELIPD